MGPAAFTSIPRNQQSRPAESTGRRRFGLPAAVTAVGAAAVAAVIAAAVAAVTACHGGLANHVAIRIDTLHGAGLAVAADTAARETLAVAAVAAIAAVLALARWVRLTKRSQGRHGPGA